MIEEAIAAGLSLHCDGDDDGDDDAKCVQPTDSIIIFPQELADVEVSDVVIEAELGEPSDPKWTVFLAAAMRDNTM